MRPEALMKKSRAPPEQVLFFNVHSKSFYEDTVMGMVCISTTLTFLAMISLSHGETACNQIDGIFWNYDREGFAFVFKDEVTYYTANLKFIEVESNNFLNVTGNYGIFSLPKNTEIPKIASNFKEVLTRGETKIVAVIGSDIRGASYYDPKEEIIVIYKSILVNLITQNVTSYTNEEINKGQVPSKIQYNVSSQALFDVFLILWGNPYLAQFYSSQPLENVDGMNKKFAIDIQRYSYFSANKLSGCITEQCLDSTIDVAAYVNGQVIYGNNYSECGYATSSFGYKGILYLIYPDENCIDNDLRTILQLLPIEFLSKDINAAMTINDTLYLITKQEVAEVTIKSNGSRITLENYEGKKSKSQLWPGIPSNVDAAYYDESNGTTYFIDREYFMTFKNNKKMNGGKLRPNLGNLLGCENYDYEKVIGKLFNVKTMDDYIKKIVKKRQGCGKSCPDHGQQDTIKKTDNTILIITLSVVAAILIISIIILVTIVCITRRRKNKVNDMSTIGGSVWNSDLTENTKAKNETTVKGKIPKRKR